MNEINLKRTIESDLEGAIARTTEALKDEGFGILTRIDFHSKMKEKLNKEIPSVVILGACNPTMAFEAYARNTDVTGLIPCNAVVRDLGNGKMSIELAKPSAMIGTLGDAELEAMACEADDRLARALMKI